jgi:uncharacterized protein YeaO (DUF488 family)
MPVTMRTSTPLAESAQSGRPPAVSEMTAQSASAEVRIKRAYEPRAPDDGQRVLVDRLWPRGLRKHDLEDAVWIRDVAPTAALRKWFGHRPERWQEFRSRYVAELRQNPAVETLRSLMANGRVTLIYGAHDQVHNQAVVLAAYLRETIAHA